MKEIIWIEEAYPSAVEGLLVDNHKALNVVKRAFTSILEMIVWVTNMIEIRVAFAILNLLGPFLFVFDILEI